MKTTTKTSISILVTILLSYGLVSAWTNLTTVSTGNSLTATLWNDMVTKINDIGSRTDGIYNSGGNIGIGVASPTKKLEVNGIVKAQNTVKAYASFNGVGGVTIYDSYGISSIVRNAAGNYTVTWTTPFLNDYYIISGVCNMWGTNGVKFGLQGNNIGGSPYEGITTTSAKIGCRDTTNADSDSDLIQISVIGAQ